MPSNGPRENPTAEDDFHGVTEASADASGSVGFPGSSFKLNPAVAQSGVAVLHYCVSEDTHTWGSEAYNILGLDEDSVEPSADVFIACVHPDDREMIAERVDRVMDGEDVVGSLPVYRIVRPEDPTFPPSYARGMTTDESWEDGFPDDAVRYVEVRTLSVSNPQHAVSEIVATMRDVTCAHKHRDEDQLGPTLDEVPNLFDNVAHNLPVGLYRVNLDENTVVAVNDYIETILGTTRDHIVGRNITDFYPAERLADNTDEIPRGKAISCEVELTTDDGRMEPAFISAYRHEIDGTLYADGVVLCPSLLDVSVQYDNVNEDTQTFLGRAFEALITSGLPQSAEEQATSHTTPEDDSGIDPFAHSESDTPNQAHAIEYLSGWMERARNEHGVIDVDILNEDNYELHIEIVAEFPPTALINELTNFAPYPHQRVMAYAKDGIIYESYEISPDFISPTDYFS